MSNTKPENSQAETTDKVEEVVEEAKEPTHAELIARRKAALKERGLPDDMPDFTEKGEPKK